MKKKDVKVGKMYTNGSVVREVVDEGPQFKLISSQSDLDNVRFKVIAKKRGPHLVGSYHNCTRTSFARWAKAEYTGRAH